MPDSSPVATSDAVGGSHDPWRGCTGRYTDRCTKAAPSQPLAATEIPGLQRICRHERLSSEAARMSRPERRRGRGAAGLSELARLLSDRDLAVLDLIAPHRFLTTKQVHAFCFHTHTTN